MENFLGRSSLSSASELAGFLEGASSAFSLGRVDEFDVFEEGYDDLNVRLSTGRGVFAVKIYAKGKREGKIRENLGALQAIIRAGLPVPRQVAAPGGETLYRAGDVLASVAEFFDGGSFDGKKPADEDVVFLAGCLATLHRLELKISGTYDSWGTANLEREFGAKKKWLDADELALVEPVVGGFRRLGLAGFRKCAIHGDWQKKHVLKRKGRYCIIDWGCLDYNAAVVDLAAFIALFAGRERLGLVLEEYAKKAALGKGEVGALPLLVDATFASCLLAAKKEESLGDKSRQTKEWVSFARGGLFSQRPYRGEKTRGGSCALLSSRHEKPSGTFLGKL